MRFVLVVGLVALSLPSLAAGQRRALTEADERARLLFQAGMIHHESGEYERALADFESAYELSRRPTLLYNIALTRERIGSLESALEAFEAFLATGVEAPNTSRDALERRVEALRRRVERLRASAEEAESAPPPSESAPPPPESAPPPSESAPPPAVELEERPLVLTPPAGDDSGTWVGLGVGAALLAAAGVVLAIVLAQPQEQPFQGSLFSWSIR